jgi:hypothetical protein
MPSPVPAAVAGLVGRLVTKVRKSASHPALLTRPQEEAIALPYGDDENAVSGVGGRRFPASCCEAPHLR